MSDKILTLATVYVLLADAIMKAGSDRAFAEKLGVSASFVSQVMNGKKAPTPSMLASIGVKRVVNFVVVSP